MRYFNKAWLFVYLFVAFIIINLGLVIYSVVSFTRFGEECEKYLSNHEDVTLYIDGVNQGEIVVDTSLMDSYDSIKIDEETNTVYVVTYHD